MADVEYEPDTLVWVSCPEAIWRPGRVKSTSASEISVELETGDEDHPEVVVVPRGSSTASAPRKGTADPIRLLRRNLALLDDGALKFDDLTDVPELHDAAVLHALDVRFAHGSIYTLTGAILLAVNPFRTLPAMYSPETLKSFLGSTGSAGGPASQQPRPRPHVFGIAKCALQGILENGRSQTVLISGESGAGKTETTKFVMQFLALAGAEGEQVLVRETSASQPSLSRQPSSVSRLPSGSTAPPLARQSSGGKPPRISQGGLERSVSTTSEKTVKAVERGMSRVERQVLGSNPLLEAFGNAKTLRNDNSSRFGKYIELQFGVDNSDDQFADSSFFKDMAEKATPRLVGALIRTYLLEKVRVVGQKKGERSFHIFYQALAAAQTPARLASAGAPLQQATDAHIAEARGLGAGTRSDEDDEVDLRAFTGRSATYFKYLAPEEGASLPTPPKGANEVEDFQATLLAMRTVGIGLADKSAIFRLLAAVLYIGNIEFASPDGESAQVATSPDGSNGDHNSGSSALEVAARLLGVPAADLDHSLCHRSVQTREGQIFKPVTEQQACETRDALARHIYHTIFSYVVDRSNKSIGFKTEATFCGVLDIFGFEFFQVNSFEQLCINFTNELLQQYFNTFIFDTEVALYKDEGITWDNLDFPDNKKIVDMLQEKTTGVLPLLDEECHRIGNSTESHWREMIIKRHDGHPNLRIVKHNHGIFEVIHFAGPVVYTIDGFLDKNRDHLSPDVIHCLQQSQDSFVSQRFYEHARAFGTTVGKQTEKVLKAQKYSVSSEFRGQLQELMTRIRSTVPHFVRCIKPNPENKAYVDEVESKVAARVPGRPPLPSQAKPKAKKPFFHRPSVSEQLRYQGVLEAIRVARAGFPVRYKHDEFLKDFGCLADKESGLRSATGGADAVRELLGSKSFQDLLKQVVGRLGNSSAVSKNGSAKGTSGWAIGRTRLFLKQEQFSALKAAQSSTRHRAATRVQARWRCHSWRQTYVKLRHAVLRLQSRSRGAAARGEVWRERRRRAATALQASFRTVLARDGLKLTHSAATKIQSQVRSRRGRLQYLQDRARLMRLQRWWRYLVRRRRGRKLQQSVLRIQCLCRGGLARLDANRRRAERHCLQRTVRKLVRIRRRIQAHKVWRKQVIEGYRHREPPKPDSHSHLCEELMRLRAEYEQRAVEVLKLKADNSRLERNIEELQVQSWLRLRSWLGK